MNLVRILLRASLFDDFVGQVGNLRPIGNRPVNSNASPGGPITNRPQDTILPHKIGELTLVSMPRLLRGLLCDAAGS